MSYLWEHRAFICLFCSLCASHIQTSKDERQSPFWSSIVFLNSPGFNLQTPVADIEQKMTKSFTIAMAYRGINYSSDFNVSLKVHTVKVVELRSLQNHGQQEIIFLVQKRHEYVNAFEVVKTFTHISLQEFAIILGVELVHKPRIYDLEAYDEADDFLWIIGAVCLTVLLLLVLCWTVALVYLYCIRAVALKRWLESPREINTKTGQSGGWSTLIEPELRSKSTQDAEVQASAAQADVSIFVTTNELLDEQHVTFQNNDRIQAHASETTATQSTKVNAKQKMRKDPVVEKMVSPIKEDRKEETQCMTIKPEPELLQAVTTTADWYDLHPIVIKQRAHPEAVEIAQWTLSENQMHETTPS
ncbi:hypothetical protein D915_001379 [Fasciola hepatica]|uniref:Uncharacterized protein n=1 Tax=Fasciola hepatica TaxID=6192 RepID=A0A4E0RIC7_FASHE|nr:hypothetical protein D915_001379 [Fasciola hepatica]